MIERFFLAYANESLKNNPQHFHKIFEQIDGSHLSEQVENRDDITIDKTEIDKVIEYIVDLSEITDSQVFLSHIEQHGSINYNDKRFNADLHYAVQAIAGEREEYYSSVNRWEKRKASKANFTDSQVFLSHREFIESDKRRIFQCDLRKVVTRCTGKDLCEESFLQKCYECHQLSFRDCLLQIVNGREYLEIRSFKDVMIWSEEISSSKTHLIIDEEKEREPFRHTLHSVKFLFPIFYEFAHGPLGNSYHTFNNFIFSLASYSLTEFLIANDRCKIKFCPYCERFFIARDIKRKTCCYSDECHKEYERIKKQKQRETDPIKYL